MNRLWNFNIEIALDSEKAIYLQIADAIIAAIKSKRLKPGDVLPSTRKLSEIISVNRNTLIKALDILLAEGWLVSRDRVGVFVAEVSILSKVKMVPPKAQPPLIKRPKIILDDGVPNTQIAPIKELARAYRRVFSLNSRFSILGYTNSTGCIEFRSIISQMLNHKRGMQTDANGICITRGSQMALYLTAQCLLTARDIVLVENPGYQQAWKAFKSAGAKIIPVSVDNEGIEIDKVKEILEHNSNVKAIYVTPHHQYPTTVTLSLERRLRLIELSNTYSFTIIEDDYDHEFHFEKRPVLPISSYSHLKKYVYIGTFSKVVAPSLRTGYLASSPGFVQKIGDLREIIDVQNDSMMEQAIVELIKNGDVKRHTRRAAKYYKEKRKYFKKLLDIHLRDKAMYTVPAGGLAFWIRPRKVIPISDLIKDLENSGIQVKDSFKYSFNEPINGFRLGYGSVSREDLEKVVVKLSELL